MADPLDRRCATCARFVRVVETVDDKGEVRRRGECLLGVWSPPIYETNTCSQWVRRGEFKPRSTEGRHRGPESRRRNPTAPSPGGDRSMTPSTVRESAAIPFAGGRRGASLDLPEDLLEMNSDEFRKVLSAVIREELGVGEVDLAGRWDGGEVIIKPAKEGVQEKRVPIDAFFHKIVMVRDRLRVLEQKINGHPKLGDDEKVQLQQYVTACYGSLTTFNVLFANRDDQFVGQKGDE